METETDIPLDPMSIRTRDESLKFLESLTQFLGAYHNHKESSAWASVALFVLAAGQLLQHRVSFEALPSRFKLILAFVVLLLCSVTLVFMHTQFELRRIAARRVASCFRVRCALIANQPQRIIPGMFEVPSGEFLPQIILDDMRQLGSVGTATLTRLERAAYVLVSLIGIGIAIRIVG